MEEKKIIVKVSAQDVLKGKFAKTLAAIESFTAVAHSAYMNNRDLSGRNAKDRIEVVKKSFEADLAELCNNITIQ